MARKKFKGEPHARINLYEMQTPAWQTLSVDARALLLELRALYRQSQANVVFLSVREAMRRLNIGQRRVERAFADLKERGWIRIETKGSFNCKMGQASAYRLTNKEDGSPGSKPTNDFMRWRPSP